MPDINGSTVSWRVVHSADGSVTYRGKLSCGRERCHNDALLDESTEYIEFKEVRDAHINRCLLNPDQRAVVEQADAVIRTSRNQAMKEAPLPRGWWITEGSGGMRRAYCSARCARLDMQRFETGER